MKTLVLIAVLAASAVLAGNAVSVEPIEPPTPYNAQWNLFREGEVRCDREGLNVYGSNDNAYMSYFGQPINIHGYDGVLMRIVYMQVTADEGDYCTLYVYDEDFERVLTHEFEVTDGTQSIDIMLDDYYGVRDLKIHFMWVSDETGVDEGFRMYSIEIYGCVWGEGEYTSIFTWDSDDVTGHQVWDVSEMVWGMACLAFEYGTEEDTQGWWAIDNVELTADGESVLPMQSGGYGVEDFSSGGWHQDTHGLSGEWEIDTDHRTGDMTDENWQCDSAAHPGWRYQAETFSPWVTVNSAGTVTCEFDTWWSPVGTVEYASFGCYTSGSDARQLFLDSFQDLDDWHTGDSGSNVVPTSWGAIKAGF